MIAKDFSSDKFLICELQNGNEMAFDYLFRKYYETECLKAKVYVYDMDKAQSLVQDCYVKLWVNRKTLNNINNLSAYLSFMVRNRCIDYLRKTKSEQALYDKLQVTDEVENADVDLLKQEFNEKLRLSVLSLPKRSKLAFEYSRFEHLTYKEIGDKMNISGKAVEALVGRALRILRKDFQSYFGLLFFFWL
jgi:RNA polymerase sigma-70 factor (ECF subfamily)